MIYNECGIVTVATCCSCCNDFFDFIVTFAGSPVVYVSTNVENTIASAEGRKIISDQSSLVIPTRPFPCAKPAEERVFFYRDPLKDLELFTLPTSSTINLLSPRGE